MDSLVAVCLSAVIFLLVFFFPCLKYTRYHLQSRISCFLTTQKC